jgi:hypothetical protein
MKSLISKGQVYIWFIFCGLIVLVLYFLRRTHFFLAFRNWPGLKLPNGGSLFVHYPKFFYAVAIIGITFLILYLILVIYKPQWRVKMLHRITDSPWLRGIALKLWLFLWYTFPKFYPRLQAFGKVMAKYDWIISPIYVSSFYILVVTTFLWEFFINERTFRYIFLVFIVYSTMAFIFRLINFIHNLLYFVCPEAADFKWGKAINMVIADEYVSENHSEMYVKFYTLWHNDGKPIIWPTKSGEEFKFRQ